MIETAYGKIPENELVLPKIPNSPVEIIKKNGELIQLSPKLAYFVGYFCVDGGLKDIKRSKEVTGRYEYKLIVGDEFLMQVELIQRLYKELFNKKVLIRTERIEKGEKFYYINPTSKYVYKFLVKVFDLPPKSKCDIVEVPKIILKANKDIRKWFVRGVFDGDGGTKTMENPKIRLGGNFVYLNMKSKRFVNQIKKILKVDFNVNFFKISSNGKDGCWKIGTGSRYIVKILNKQKLFIAPIKRWRLEKLATKLGQFKGGTGTVSLGAVSSVRMKRIREQPPEERCVRSSNLLCPTSFSFLNSDYNLCQRLPSRNLVTFQKKFSQLLQQN